MSLYNSSEDFQRHRSVFADRKEKTPVDETQKQKLTKMLDAYIKLHSSTVSMREEAKKNHRSADYQLDLSAELVTILEKIKKEMR